MAIILSIYIAKKHIFVYFHLYLVFLFITRPHFNKLFIFEDRAFQIDKIHVFFTFTNKERGISKMNFKSFLGVILVLFVKICVLTSFENSTIDSLYIKLNLATSDTTKINILIEEIGAQYELISPDSAIAVYKEAIGLADKILGDRDLLKFDKQKNVLEYTVAKQKAVALRYLARNLTIKNIYSNALIRMQQSLEIYEKLNYQIEIAKSYNSIGYIHFLKGDYSPAMEFYLKAIKILKEKNEDKYLAKSYGLLANIFIKQGLYENALKYYLSSLKISEKLGNKNLISQCYTNIGIIHAKQKNFSQALEYYQKAIKMKESINDQIGTAYIYNNMGIIYKKMKNFDLAKEYYHKSLKLFQEAENDLNISACLNNLGLIETHLENYQLALNYYNESLKIKIENDDKYGKGLVYSSLAELHLTLHEKSNKKITYHLKRAEEFSLKSYKIANELKLLPLQKTTANLLRKIYQNLGDYEKSFEFTDIYIAKTDSLLSKEKTQALAEMESKYKIEKKELEIQNLHKENQLRKLEMTRSETIRNKQMQIIIVFIIGFLLIIIFVILLIRSSQQMKKTNKLLEEKNNEISSKKNKIKIQNIELSSKNKQLDELILTKDKFISILAHDLRNPFNIILGTTEVLSQNIDYFSKEKIATYCLSLHKTAQNTHNLFEELLEWALIQQNKVSYNPEKIVINPFITEVVNSAKTYSEPKNIKISAEIETVETIIADAKMLKTILRNLLINAIKFTQKGKEIKIFVDENHEGIVISVQDNGIGMNKETIDSLFKVDKTKSRVGTNGEKGTGFGLILCKEFIEKHNGKIWVKSEIDKGSQFYFLLPQSVVEVK